MTRFFLKKLFSLMALLLFTTSAWGFSLKKPVMSPGQTAIIHALTPAKKQPLSGLPSLTNLRIMFDLDGAALSYKDPAEVLMFEHKGDKKPLYRLTNVEIADSYKTTGCSEYAVQLLKTAFEGDALFCGGSLNIDRVHYFLIKRPGEITMEAADAVTQYTDASSGIRSVVILFDD